MQVPQGGEEMNDYEDNYNLEEMGEDEKDQLILKLVSDLNRTHIIAVGLHNSMIDFALELGSGDTLGKRGQTMRSVAFQCMLMSQVVRGVLTIDERKSETDSAFDDIVSRFDSDD